MMIQKGFKRILTTALLAATCTMVQAQQLQAKLSHYSTDDGLASNAISNMKQDGWGFVWIATWNGLSRFDGYDFYNYRTGTASHIPNLHNRIEHIVIDTQQNVWMLMYDSRVFVMRRSLDRIVNPFEGISGNEEFRADRFIFATSGGDVLVPIVDKGIYKMRVEPDGVKCQLITTGGLHVTSMAEGYQNDIWLGTNEGIHRMDASNMTVERKGYFLDQSITCLYSNGYNIYAGSTSGKILSFAYGQDPVEIRHGGTLVSTILVDGHGLIWFGDSETGVCVLNPETGVERRYTQTLKQMNYDGYNGDFCEVNGTVWMYLNHGGFGYYDREREELMYFHNDPSNPWDLSNVCNASLVTSDGVVFESTNRRGLEKLEIMKNTIEKRLLIDNSEQLYDNDIRALCYDKRRQQLLMANKSGMLFIIGDDGSRTVITKSDSGEPLRRIYGIMKDSKENIWLASKDAGLFRMTARPGGGYAFTHFQHDDANPQSLSDDRAYQTVEDNDGNLWVATFGGGVNLLPRGATRFIHCGNEMAKYPRNAFRKVRTVALDKDGKVWAGTTDGILMLSYENGQVNIERLEPSEEQPESYLLSPDIVCLNRDAKGMMWVGTNGGGLSHTTGKDSQGRWLFENFGAADGLPSEEILSLAFDSRGGVWFATEHVLCSFDEGKRIFTTFSTLEGVDETMCSENAALVLPKGIILFGTTNGYYVVDRSKLMNNNAALFRLHLTSFWVDDELQSPQLTDLYDFYVPDAKEVELPSHKTSFAFRFASLNYQLQHRVHYQYMLEGYDTDWHNAGKDRIARYDNVPSGNYKFIVRAFLLESPDKYDQREIAVVVPPMFFFSSGATWFYMLLVAVCGLLLLFLSQRRIREKVKRQRAADDDGFIATPSAFVQKLEGWLAKHYAEHDLAFDSFLEAQGMCRADLEEMLRNTVRKTPREFLTDYRLNQARQMLEQTNDNIADVSFNCGFSDPVQFNRLFTEKSGLTPSQYRDRSRQDNSPTDEYEILK